MTARQASGPGSPERPARALTWAEGRRVHLGRATVTVAQAPLSLDVVDAGAAFVTLNGGIWFTDGVTVEQIGLSAGGRRLATGLRWGPAGKPRDWVVSGNTGSRLAWFEFPRSDRPEVVVYDAAERRRVARHPVDVRADCPRCARLLSVDASSVYWSDSVWQGYGTEPHRGSRRSVMRLDVTTGAVRRTPAHCLTRSLRAQPRMLVVGGSASGLTDGIGQEFLPVGRRLVASGISADPVRDTGSGEPLRLRTPPGLEFGPAERLLLFQWLDDDRFALVDASGWNAGVLRGEDLVVCTLSAHSCVVAVERSRSAGSPVLPGIGTPGSETAIRR